MARKPPGLVVNGYSAEWLKKGFPWVYPDEVVDRPSQGGVVTLEDGAGNVLGTAILDDGWLSARRFRTDGGPLDEDWMEQQVAACLQRREGLLPPDTDAWRLVHAENDGLPGVRVDVWGPEVTIRLDSPSLVPLLPGLLKALQHHLEPRAVHLGWRLDPREKSQKAPKPRLLLGSPGPVVVKERGVSFAVEPSWGPDAGLYPDMRDNRAWLDPLWSGRTLLNLFAYTGAFSVFAALRGGGQTTSVDLAAEAHERARENFRHNGLDPDQHRFVQEDTFRALDYYRRRGERFDVVLLDPPAHSHGPSGDFRVEKDLGRLVAASLRALEPGGFLVVACNDGTLPPRAFQEAIFAGQQRLGRPLRQIHTGTQAPDFPAAVDFPEGRYLKFVVLRG